MGPDCKTARVRLHRPSMSTCGSVHRLLLLLLLLRRGEGAAAELLFRVPHDTKRWATKRFQVSTHLRKFPVDLGLKALKRRDLCVES